MKTDIIEVEAKLAGMRKPQSFIVYPRETDHPDTIVVQSDRAIGMFNKTTGKGLLNWKGSNSKYGAHLSRRLGAESYIFPRDFVLKCLEMRPNSGDLIGTSDITGPVRLA